MQLLLGVVLFLLNGWIILRKVSSSFAVREYDCNTEKFCLNNSNWKKLGGPLFLGDFFECGAIVAYLT